MTSKDIPEPSALPVLDPEGYPTAESLEALRAILAEGGRQKALDAFYLALTVNHFGCCGPDHKEVRGRVVPVWEYHTGGWSGHEEIVAALSSNLLLWSLLLQRYDAGGHYYFRSPLDSPPSAITPSPPVVAHLERLRR